MTAKTFLRQSIPLLLVLFFGSFAQTQAAEMSGVWVKKEQNIRGSWSIVLRDSKHYLELDEEFRTKRAPDLKLVLSKQSVEHVNNDNAMEGGVVISQLESARGAQSYLLPENFAEYSTLLINCEKFSKLWGATSIQ